MMRKFLMIATASLGLAAAAHPDLSGVWQTVSTATALLTEDGKTPPLKPDALQAYEATKAKRAAGDVSWDGPDARCRPPGEPRILTEQFPFEIVQQKNVMFFAYQWNRLNRVVPINNKPLDVRYPTYFGTAVGHWQGNQFIIDAGGFNNKTFLDRDGLPHGTGLKLKEIFSLSPDGKTLHAAITVSDSEYYTQDWTTDLSFNKLDQRIREDICTIRLGIYKPAQ